MGTGMVPAAVQIRSGPANKDQYLEVNADGSINVNVVTSSISVTPVPSVVAVNDSPDQLIAANASRKNCIIQNLGPDDVFIGYTNGVTTANAAIRLPMYGYYELRGLEGVVVSAVFGICDTGDTANVGVTEIS